MKNEQQSMKAKTEIIITTQIVALALLWPPSEIPSVPNLRK